jgi:tRNA pseudouridine55 synthase
MRTANGILNIDKPAGWTSHDVVAKVRSLLKVKKVGHTGTLDPDATGVLPVCFGKGTKIVPYLVGGDKAYEAVLRLGLTTDTQDVTGRTLRTCEVPPYLSSSVADTMSAFLGVSMQTPPMYSAVKIGGVPLYKAAREGRVIDRLPRPITVHDIRLHHIEGNDVSFSVVVSKGTYIRTLCADLGDRMGVGGCLLSLRRTRSGPFHIQNSIAMDALCDLYARGGDAWEAVVAPLSTALQALPILSVSDSALEKIRHGAPVGPSGCLRFDPFKKGDSLRILAPDGALLAVGTALMDSPGATEREWHRSTHLFKVETLLMDEPVAV